MSATNSTTTIGLSQYISTDKPTYLVDYNGDMLKIDGAIAADRESIGDVNTVAQRADGKADTNKESIDTLNDQINGDPEDPSDTGMAGKVTDNSSDIETMQALIGNGTPTTSNQTIIGAINGLEGAVAPREDGDTLANSYVQGAQFARGGSVYTALVPLTSGTAFASLVLNTDYANSSTLVEQIESAAGEAESASQKITAINNNIKNKYMIRGEAVITSVTADGVKTVSALLDELHAALQSALSSFPNGVSVQPLYMSLYGFADCKFDDVITLNNQTVLTNFTVSAVAYNSSADRFVMQSAHVKASGSNTMGVYIDTTNATIDAVAGVDSTVPTSGYTFNIVGNILDAVPSI